VVDSPRWPHDLDWSRPGTLPRREHQGGRAIDRSLRRLARQTLSIGAAPFTLSMFPTPPLGYFVTKIAAASCKPHLRAFGYELFGDQSTSALSVTRGTFTRFMLAGFAVYRALELIGVAAYEGYPDLQFRLWIDDGVLPSKGRGPGRAAALAARQQIIAKLATKLKVVCPALRTLDQADAAVLAFSLFAARTGSPGYVIDHPAEGHFWVSLPAPLARLIQIPDD
jgi:hypothetical protein